MTMNRILAHMVSATASITDTSLLGLSNRMEEEIWRLTKILRTEKHYIRPLMSENKRIMCLQRKFQAIQLRYERP